MSGNRILWGQITLVLAVVLATTWTATQWTAWRLGFQPQLGQPWFELAQGMPVYYPPAFFWCPAGARGKERRDLWFGALGLQRGNP